MQKLKKIDEKIASLKQKKKLIFIKEASFFLKEAQKIIGHDDFSPQLALNALKDSWCHSSSQQKEAWKQPTPTFQNKTLNPPKSETKDNSTHP